MTEPNVPSVAAPEPRQSVRPKRVESEAAPRQRIREFEVMVAEVIRETPDTATLVLFTGNDRLEYKAGQFLTIRPQQFPALERFCRYFEDVKGKREPGRAYSMCSAPHERQLAFTVKEEQYISGVTPYPPLLSPYLTWRVLPGTRMTVTGFGGPYVLAPDVESRTDHIVHICAGSGIVPNFSILKHCLATGMSLRHTLIYGNKTWEDVIFQRQLEELARQHPEKLQIVHTLSREDRPASSPGEIIRRGRVSEELIREFIPDPTAIEVYTCGPGLSKFERQAAKAKGEEPTPRFLETTLEALASVGVPSKRIHYESYG
jgi:3-ketosteroid 9alpha-monooxygenase subunit B